MLSSREYELAISSLKYFSKFKILLPVYWSKNELKCIPTKIPRRIFIYQNILQISHVFFIFYRIMKCYNNDQIVWILPNALLFIAQMAVFSFRSPMWIYTSEFVSLFNQTNRFNFNMAKKFEEEESASSKTREKIFYWVIMVINAAAMSANIQFLIGNIIEFSSITTYLLYVLMISPFMIEFQISFNYAVIPFMSSLITINGWIYKACVLWPKETGIEASKKTFLVYKCCYILNEFQNKVFGSIFVPLFKVCLITATLVTSFTVINLRNLIPVPITLFFVVYLFTTTTLTMPAAMLMSTIYNISKNFHKNLMVNWMVGLGNRFPYETKLLKKILKSTPVLRSQVGSFYFMEGYAKLTLLDNLVRGIAFMLITYNDIKYSKAVG